MIKEKFKYTLSGQILDLIDTKQKDERILQIKIMTSYELMRREIEIIDKLLVS